MVYNEEMEQENRVILVESNGHHRKVLNFNLSVYVGVEVICKNNADAVTGFLKKSPDIKLIVSEEVVGKERTILKIYYYVVSNKLDIPIILSGYCQKLASKIEMYEKADWQKIIRECARILGVTAKSMAQKEFDKYYPIPANTLLAMKIAPVDIFFSEGPGKTKILFPMGEEIDQKSIRKQLLDHQSCLFVLSKARLRFANSFSDQIFDFIGNPDISVEERIKATGMAFEKIHEVVGRAGMSGQAIQMAKKTVESIVTIAASSYGLSDLIDILYDSEEPYLYRHSLLVAVVSHRLIGAMSWGNEEQKVKITFAALFHDVAIPDKGHCQIHSQEELDDCDISEEEKMDILNHAFKAAKLIEDVPDIPFGVDTIIIQHHGSLNGVGFKGKEQDGRLSRLATVFLVVEEYVDSLVNAEKGSFDHNRIVEKLKSVYSQGNFAKTVSVLGGIKKDG